MRAKIFLADSAEIREGLLFLLAGGWTDVGPSPQPFAIAGLVEVEWDETNARHSLELTIENEDGAPLVVPTPTGDQPVRVASEFEVGRPAGSARGSSFNMALAVPIIPLPWTPGRRYVVRLRIDGADVDQVRFAVRQSPPGPPR